MQDQFPICLKILSMARLIDIYHGFILRIENYYRFTLENKDPKFWFLTKLQDIQNYKEYVRACITLMDHK